MYWTTADYTDVIADVQPFYEQTYKTKRNPNGRLDGSSNQNESKIIKVRHVECNNMYEYVTHENPDEVPTSVKQFNWGQLHYRF